MILDSGEAPRPHLWAILGKLLAGIAVIGYPVLVYFGLTRWSPRVLALVLICILVPAVVIRLRGSQRGAMRGLASIPLVTVVALVLAAVLDSSGYVLMVPVAINSVLLIAFGGTLRAGSIPMIERFARLQVEELSLEQRAWCRMWTWLWCGFFVVNGCVALGLALAAPLSWWAVYNGLIAYALIGVMFASEWVLRRRRFGPDPQKKTTTRNLLWEDPSESRDGERRVYSFRTHLPEDYIFFEGHFPTYPVLAGAVQLHELVLPCLKRVQPKFTGVTKLTGLKFPARLGPGQPVEVVLRLEEDGARGNAYFEISRDGVSCSTGRLSFVADREESAE